MKLSGKDVPDDWSRLSDASRKLIAERGIAKFSLRTLARESGWTIGELSYRLGNKDQLFAKLMEAENQDWQARDALWLAGLSGISSFDCGELAAIIIAYLDHLALDRRLASIVRYEMLAEQMSNPILHAQAADWIEQTKYFWDSLLAGRVSNPAAMARVIHAYVAGELIYSLALGNDPTYRVARQVCVHRLCNGISGVEGGSDGELLKRLHDRQSRNEPALASYGERARATAVAAGNLMMERGVAAVTHRSVGERMGISGSAVAYHFPTRPDVFAAAIDALSDQARKAREAGVDDIVTAGNGATDKGSQEPIYTLLRRALLIMALAATRDSAFLPVARRLRIERGKHFYVEDRRFKAKKRLDRWAAQLSSIVLFGASVQAAARGETLSSMPTGLQADIDLLTR